jgi:single-strand DNA-binding protein
MANLNKVFLMGNLTRDPELRATQGGTNVCKFGMAVNRRWKGTDGQMQESTCFVDLTAFGRQAETLNQYCKKGKPLFVEGRLEFSTWQTQDGQKRNKLEVIVENFQFLGAPSGRQAGGDAPEAGNSFGGAGFGEGVESEIPF